MPTTQEGRIEKFTASVSQNIITKADRFFNNSLTTIFFELVQNARRAGATCLDVEIQDDNSGALLIKMVDNGPGVNDPRTLLTLGESAWGDKQLAEVEDPAGMGFFSLAGVGCVVRSRNWTMALAREHFVGEKEVEVEFDCGPYIQGTSIEFVFNMTGTYHRSTYFRAAKDTLCKAVCYCPLQVTLNGEPIEQKDFLHDAILIGEYEGVRVGVVQGNRWVRYDLGGRFNRVNFFGIVVEADSPVVAGYNYSVAFDVTAANKKLRLELPTRNRVIEDDFWHKLMEYGRVLLYESILKCQGGVHTLAYKEWKAARDMGIILPEPSAELQPLEAVSESHQRTSYRNADDKPIQVDGPLQYVKLNHDWFSDILHTLPLVTELASNDGLFVVGYKPDYAGYTWYDAIPEVTSITVKDQDGTVRYKSVLDEHPEEEIEWTEQTPQSLTIEISVSGREEPYTFNLAALILEDDDYCGWLEEAKYIVSQNCIDSNNGRPNSRIEEMMWRAYWDYTEDSECDSYDTQKQNFERDLNEILLRIFRGPVDGAKTWIRDYLNTWDFKIWLSQTECQSLLVEQNKDRTIKVTFS